MPTGRPTICAPARMQRPKKSLSPFAERRSSHGTLASKALGQSREWPHIVPSPIGSRISARVSRPRRSGGAQTIGPIRTLSATTVKRRQRPDTTAPCGASFDALTSDSRCSGWSTSSSSRNRIHSPVAAAMPALRAALGPRAVSCLMTRASGNSAASMASVLSVDASSTTTSSLSGHVCSRALRSAWRSQSRRLRVGTMMETLSLKTSRRPDLLHAERPFLAYLCY